MLERIQDLYAHIFLFLASVMDWLMEKRYKRMLDSFNENFSKHFEDQINVINQKAELIKRLAEQSTRAEIRVTRLMMEDVQRDIRIGLQADARQQAELHYWKERMVKEFEEARKGREQTTARWNQLASATKLMLQESTMVWLGLNQKGSSNVPVSPLDNADPPFVTSTRGALYLHDGY